MQINKNSAVLFLLATLAYPNAFAQEGMKAGSIPTGHVHVTILDSVTNQPTAVRVRLTRDDHVVRALPANAAAVMYGVWDHSDGYGFQPDSAFYVEGSFELELPAGEYEIVISKGIEYLDQRLSLRVTAR
ncbi:MAG TPA: hypothetical protein VD816_00510, partial [Ohtaekwangia sp.]|nr:hypothetical protein [Ohtaekwangia sp.]